MIRRARKTHRPRAGSRRERHDANDGNDLSFLALGPSPRLHGAPIVVRLADGAGVRVRPLRASDEPALRAAFHALSPWSRYQRFLGQVSDLDAGMWRHLCRVDLRDHVALAAFTDEQRIVGVARFIRIPGDWSIAEVAVTVADDWQQRGLGTHLLEALTDLAGDLRVRSFVAHAFASNVAIHRLLAKAGPMTVSRDGPESTIVVELRASTTPSGA
ncbi:MAG: GNAT family N-acetyltransferase [Labilithrix sp.]|nr:GNAT family N-acetyltransferase [Labilithrix sp.]MCW5815728.1 GNAT family N-acetyltransferase [Labilithrix sp.]